MTAVLALCFLVGYVILDAWFVRNKIRGLNAAIESLRYFAGRAREMQDLWYEETGDSFIMVGGDGSILSMNPSARRLVGALVEPVAGRPLSAFLKTGCEVFLAVQGALKDGDPVRRRAVKVRPVRTAEATREITIKVVEVAGHRENGDLRQAGRREAWIILGIGKG